MIDDHKTVHAMVWVIMDGLVTVMSGAWPYCACLWGWTTQLLSGAALSECESENLCGCMHI